MTYLSRNSDKGSGWHPTQGQAVERTERREIRELMLFKDGRSLALRPGGKACWEFPDQIQWLKLLKAGVVFTWWWAEC